MNKVEKFGVLLDLPDGNTGLIPNAELATERGSDHIRMFPVGQELEVKVLEIDSKTPHQAVAKSVAQSRRRKGLFGLQEAGSVPTSLGSFGDLLSQLEKSGE